MKKNKYVMIPINSKLVGLTDMVTRYILIRYSNSDDSAYGDGTYTVRNYIGTKLLEMDPYLKDPTKSHQYEFYDDYYVLTDGDQSKTVVGEKRIYHAYLYFKPWAEPIEFEEVNDVLAIKHYVESKYYDMETKFHNKNK